MYKTCNLVMNHHLLRQKISVGTMKKSVNNCIGYIGQIPSNHDFRKFEKSVPSKIENLPEISMFSYDVVNRPTYGDLNPIFDTDFSKAHRLVLVSDYTVPERLFQTSVKTRVCSSFDFVLKNICVVKIGFGNEEKKLRWGLSTRVLN